MMREKMRLLFWRLILRLRGLAPIAGGAKDDDEGDEGDEEDEVDEEKLDDKVKEVLKKERKARRDAEKAARKAEREAAKERSDLQDQISTLEGKVESATAAPKGGKDGEGENKDLAAANKKIEELEGQLEEANGKVEAGTKATQQAHLLAELRNPDYGIASDAVDLVSGQLEIEYDDAGKPQGVKDAVEELLESRPSLKRREESGELGGVTAGNADASRGRGGSMSAEQAKKLAADNPEKFNEMFEKGEIPAGALGG